jgi:hypothetical protein
VLEEAGGGEELPSGAEDNEDDMGISMSLVFGASFDTKSLSSSEGCSGVSEG